MALQRLFLSPLDCIACRYLFLLLGIAYFSILMSSGKRKNGADARAKKAALLFVACERNPNPTGRLSIPNVLRVNGYSEDGMTDGRRVSNGALSSMAAVTPSRESTAPAPAATTAKEKKPPPSRRLFSFAEACRMA